MIKQCSRCLRVLAVVEFHKQQSGRLGRHSWCKACANAAQKQSRAKHGRPPAKRQWNLRRRYGLSVQAVTDMRAAQGGACAICRTEMRRECVDHDHANGKVRGLLCHSCNIKLHVLDKWVHRDAAIAYLDRSK